MEITKQWIVDEHRLLVKLKDGTYKIGQTTSLYGFDLISKEKALELINAT